MKAGDVRKGFVMRRLITVTTIVIVGAALAGSCGLPQSSEFEPINGDVPFGLDETTTTSTSTIPPTTIDATSTTSPSTTAAIETEDVLLFFVAGGQLTSVSVPLPRDAALAQVMAALQKGPPSGDIGTGLRSTLPTNPAILVKKDRGTAVIDLPANIFDSMPSRDQRLLFGQLVLTIGRLGGIGQVQFTQVGIPIPAINGRGTITEPGATVTIDDYALLESGAPPETTTTTTTSLPIPVPIDPAATSVPAP